jgi:argininosuccinate lyase
MSEHKERENARPDSGRLWGGGFRREFDPGLEKFCESFSFDRRLLEADVACNRAWIAALQEAGILTAEETARIDAALCRITVGDGGETSEDVHSYVESRLAIEVGAELAGKLRTGRSRNDLVATDLRIWCRQALTTLRARIAACVAALADLAERSRELVVPGYTHMRRAQPILMAHLLLAHAHRLMRDDERCASVLDRLDECPLGSGALAGTTVAIDRLAIARRLGFSRASANSLDAVADRDFVADALHASSLVMIHLSQLAEDLILATAEEFGWLALGDAGATGSSLMPQKKNPDVLELVRGRAGRVLGRLTGFLATLKGLPSSYNRDLQEDKEPLFDALDTAASSLHSLAILLPILTPVASRGLSENSGDLVATDLADYLVARAVPFARAHHLAGEAAARARRDGVSLACLPIAALRSISPLFAEDVTGWLETHASLARRDRPGGTAPERVAEDLVRVRSWIADRGAAVGAPQAVVRDPS